MTIIVIFRQKTEKKLCFNHGNGKQKKMQTFSNKVCITMFKKLHPLQTYTQNALIELGTEYISFSNGKCSEFLE